MNDQNVVNEAPVKKMSPATLLSVISLALAIVGGLVFGFVYFIWPNIVGVVTFIVWPVFLLMYVPLINLIPIALVTIVDFIVGWAGWLAIAAVVVALSLSLVNIFVVCQKKAKGLTLISAIVSGAVLAIIFVTTFVNMILTVLGLSLSFSALVILYILMFMMML